MISLLIDFIIFVMDFFCLVDNSVVTIIEIEEVNDFSSFLRKHLKKEIEKELEEENDFLKNFNARYNNN